MSDDDQLETRELIEDVFNDGEAEIQETVLEAVIEGFKPVKANAKPRINVTNEPVEPTEVIIEEYDPVVEGKPVVGDKPQKVDKLKEMVQCPDYNLSMAQHTLKHIQKINIVTRFKQKQQLRLEL